MSSQINHVKSEVSKMVNFINETKLKTKNTVKYTLLRFSDPEVYAPQATKDITKFLKFLNEITVSSGGDCPELSMKALIKAIDNASKEATVYLITDASAKDAHLHADVIAKAGSKKIDINMLLTGSCSPIDPVYQKIATETGGQLAFINGNQEEIGSYFNIVKPNLSGDLRPILIAEDILNNEPRSYTIPVDSTMTSIVASVSMDSKGEIKLFRPDGNEVKTGESDVLISDMLNGRVFNVTKPSVGKWRLSVSGNSGIHYSVSAMGNSDIDFDSFDFVEEKEYREGKEYHPIDGQPSIGTSQAVTATIFGTYSTAKFEFISEKGNTIKLIDLQTGREEVSEGDFFGIFDLPTERFRVVARGTDQNGAEFMQGISDSLSRTVC